MRQYYIEVVVNENEIRIIKDQFNSFMEEAEEFSLTMEAANDTRASEELDAVLKKMFLRLLVVVNYGDFKGVQ